MTHRISRCVWPILLGLALMSGVVFLLGAEAEAGSRVPPVLVDQEPAPNVHTASLDAVVQATYDQVMDPVTVNYRTFAVHAMQTGWLTETLAVQGGSIVLTPTALFHPGELVRVSATTATLSLGAEGPITPTVWEFRTGAGGRAALFQDSGQRLGNDDNRGLAIGDLDGDGDIDAFVPDFSGANQIFLNDGAGGFARVNPNLGDANTIGIALGDLDGDGDLDAFESKADGTPNRIWFNDGAAGFTDNGQALGTSSSFYAALGDLDGDGDLDAFVPNGTQSDPQPNRVYFNDGNGILTDSGQSLGNNRSLGVALGDLDSDGDLDAVVANGGWVAEPNKVWLNDGAGFFTDSGQTLGGGVSLMPAVGDLNADGHLDAFFTNRNDPAGSSADEVWLNQGDGTFTFGQTVGSEGTAGVALGDLDGDGDLDILVCRSTAATIWLNGGGGTLAASEQPLNGCTIPALGDLTGDGALDAFLAYGPQAAGPNEVWFNEPLLELFLPFVVLN